MAVPPYDEAELVRWLYGAQRFGIKLGLENTQRLFSALGDPHRRVPCIHVAGTNGKGSVCAMLDACLREAGLRTGLYTSPHLVRFTERMRIDGTEIQFVDVTAGLARLREMVAAWERPPTFFEITTALAFDWFVREQCDVVVLETGMGGRLDSTNIVDPLASVITPIAMDHAQWLGDTIEQIAAEKAGIIKPGRPVISAPQTPAAGKVLALKAHELEASIHFVSEPWAGEIGLVGCHQRWNAAVAKAAIEASGLDVSDEALRRGLANVVWPGRFQRLHGRWILDGAHNPHAARALVATWEEEFGDLRVPILFGCLADKQPRELLEILLPIASEFHLVPVQNERGLDPKVVRDACAAPSTAHPRLDDALRALSQGPGPVLVTGSLFLIGEVIEALPADGMAARR